MSDETRLQRSDISILGPGVVGKEEFERIQAEARSDERNPNAIFGEGVLKGHGYGKPAEPDAGAPQKEVTPTIAVADLEEYLTSQPQMLVELTKTELARVPKPRKGALGVLLSHLKDRTDDESAEFVAQVQAYLDGE